MDKDGILNSIRAEHNAIQYTRRIVKLYEISESILNVVTLRQEVEVSL